MIKTVIKKTTAALLLAALALPSYGQDLLARQAPVDKKMRAVDSIAIQRLFQKAAGVRSSLPKGGRALSDPDGRKPGP